MLFIHYGAVNNYIPEFGMIAVDDKSQAFVFVVLRPNATFAVSNVIYGQGF